MKRHPTSDAWLEDQDRFVPEATAVLRIIREAGLDEGVKWGQPTFMLDGHNVVLMGIWKDGVVVSYLRGALLDDPGGHLVQPGSSRHSRYLPLASLDELADKRALLDGFLAAAITLTREGRRVPKQDPEDLDLPDELVDRMDADPAFAEAFWGMTPGRRRGHALHIGGAKTPKGRASRLDKCGVRILQGKGIHECICGRSQRPPRCDGTHNKPLGG